jgi:putative ABC transport system substrate-binding protein
MNRLRKACILILLFPLLFFFSCQKPPKTLYTIGIVQLLDSPTANETRKGLIQALEDGGLKDGVNVQLKIRNGMGDISEVQRIAQEFVNEKVDMIVPISTPCLQAALIVSQDIPIIFSSVANPYLTRAGVSPTEHLGNVTGVSSEGPIKETLKLVKETLPLIKKVGTLWTPSELNSEYYLEIAREGAAELGFELVAVPVSNPSEVLLAAQVLINKKIDVIYQISDNTVNASFVALGKVADDNGIPLFGGFLRSTELGACAAMGWEFFDMGYKTGQIVLRVKGGESPIKIAFQSMTTVKLHLNQKAAEKQGVKFPDAVLRRASEVLPPSDEVLTTKPTPEKK